MREPNAPQTQCCFSLFVMLHHCIIFSRPADKREEYDEPDFALIDTLFSLAEAHLFMQARGRPGAGWAGVRGLLAPAPRGLGCPWRATPVCPSLTAAIAASIDRPLAYPVLSSPPPAAGGDEGRGGAGLPWRQVLL